MRLPRMIRLAVAAAAAAAAAARAAEPSPPVEERLPLWEGGLFAGGGWVADYPAAGENHFKGIALPYVIYRGRRLRIGDRGILRGRVLDIDRLELDLSLDGALPADSYRNEARRGMPDLDYLLEAGPELVYRISPPAEWLRLDLAMPLRAAVSADLISLEYEGMILNPQLRLRDRGVLGTGLSLSLRAGPIFGFDGANDYYYAVPSRSATPERRRYDAKDGYVGTELDLLLRHPLGNRWKLHGGIRFGVYEGSANEQSPLFRDAFNISAGLGLSWALYQSERRAAPD